LSTTTTLRPGLLILLASLAWPAAAFADVRDAVNWARLQGCRSPGVRTPLKASAKLEAAAARMAGGQSLHGALDSTGYLATQTAAVHLSGAVGDSDVSRILAANDCASLQNPQFTEMGTLRRGRDFWLVLAAPVSLPTIGDAPDFSRQILTLVNQARAGGRRCGRKSFGAARPLALNRALTAAALAHSQDMARFREFEHRGHDGSTPPERVTRAGYGDYSVVGENIAAGAMTPAEVTQGWLDSPPHCENIMDPRFTEIGIAYAVNASSAELVYWTQDFALPARTAPRR
jgi:uncharacterized protein YkwD